MTELKEYRDSNKTYKFICRYKDIIFEDIWTSNKQPKKVPFNKKYNTNDLKFLFANMGDIKTYIYNSFGFFHIYIYIESTSRNIVLYVNCDDMLIEDRKRKIQSVYK